MRHRLKLTAVIIVISIVAMFFTCCSDRTVEVKSISIKANSFKESYEVDEHLNYTNIFILVTYNNGETEYIQCDFSMVKDFNTSICGSKQLYVEYSGVKSETFNYEVVYSIDNSKTIITTARLEYTPEVKNDILSYGINYYCGDLTNVQAILFSISADLSLNIDEDFSNLSYELPSGWAAYVVNSSTQNLRVLVYNRDNEEGLSANTNFNINVNLGNSEAVTQLSDIEVSTGGETATKYYLPNYVR